MMDEAETELIDPNFKDVLLHKLNEFRQSNTLCDTTLRAQEQEFAAHRCVLSAASPYFRALFASQFQQNKVDERSVIELKEIKGEAFKQVLQFMYTGEAKVNFSTARDLIVASDYLIIPSLKSRASQFLEKSINASNCFVLESFASQYHCESLEQAAIAYQSQNFTAVVKADDFKSLEFEKVKKLLCKDELNVSQEEHVYEAVITWVKHDLASRECFFPELLNCVRLFSMSKYSLRKISEEEELVTKNHTCLSVVLGGLDFVIFPDRFHNVAHKPRLSLQKYEHAVVLTGGYEKEQPSQTTFAFVLSTMQWLTLPKMPLPQYRHGADVCGGQLYMLGGAQPAPICCFYPKQNKWSSITNQFPPRSHCCVVTFREKLYVIGGEGHLHNVDRFDPVFSEWKAVTLMEYGRTAHCAVVQEDHIYIIAGNDNRGHFHTSVERYNPTSDKWDKIPDITHPRRYAAAATICGKILVVGGFSDMRFENIEASCELFDPDLNQWSLVPSPNVPCAACGIVSFKGCVYLFGGENANHEQYKLNSVECYSAKENEWKEVSVMPQRLYCLQASLVLLPKKYMHTVNTVIDL
ncbi:kelch repeat and BTB domain-containing protein 3-like [Oculina patagonica]